MDVFEKLVNDNHARMSKCAWGEDTSKKAYEAEKSKVWHPYGRRICYCSILTILMMALEQLNLIEPLIAVPVMILAMCYACFCLGRILGPQNRR